MPDYSIHTVSSADGTAIGYRQLGSGPGVILVHGGMQAAQHLMKLATALSSAFTVYVVDRRGRGASAGAPSDFGVGKQVEDIQAIVTATGATRIFGLSAGALVALRTALVTPALTRVALYEPPLSVRGSAPTAWVARYDREVAEGRLGPALVTALKGLGTEPLFARVPRFLLVPPLAIGARLQGPPPAGDSSINDLVPTLHADMTMIAELADTAADYASLGAEVLLLGGSKSPAFLGIALDALEGALPHARRMTLDGLGHSGPDDDGDPERVAEELRPFFSA